jgi:hypothetical protein
MPLDPPLTYRGALRILGECDSKKLDQVNAILGGALLASPAAALAGPAAGLTALYAWVDQKNEALGIVRGLIKSGMARLADAGGYERHQLIAAAHTALVVASFYEVLQEALGKEFYGELHITSKEKERLSLERWRNVGEPLLTCLYLSPVAAPSAATGFHENCLNIQRWLNQLADRTFEFAKGLSAWTSSRRSTPKSLRPIAAAAVRRYKTLYLKMSADVPEFFIWASFGEHLATRQAIKEVSTDLIEAVTNHHQAALSRLNELLRITTDREADSTREHSGLLYRANLSVLSEPIVPVGSQMADERVAFPTIDDGYVASSYRSNTFDGATSKPWDEEWWKNQTKYDDLDLRIFAHITAPSSTRQPCLLLGHPGAGKSLLTKVLAAKLPRAGYTALHVPLRRVGSDAPVFEQIEQGLRLVTHGRTTWRELSQQSRETMRVVLLDGLDELLQASTSQRTAYLQEIVEFQRLEEAQDRPVVVLVTSRTVVADRVAIPPGTLILRLEEFGRPQVERWLENWRSSNFSRIQAGGVRALDVDTAMQNEHLAAQPLLLMMLALYSADPDAPALDDDLSTAALYRRLLEQFAFREAMKPSAVPHPEPVDQQVEKHLWRLTVTACGMFNRGRQSIDESELGADLAALDHPVTNQRSEEIGRRTIDQFFFVHAAESDGLRASDNRRHYEFLHATFGEFLVASGVVDEVDKLADTAEGRRGFGQVDDDLLFAFLSHHPLATRSSILNFATQLILEKPASRTKSICRILDTVIVEARNRIGSPRYQSYRPTAPDQVREIAAYSANAILLRVAATQDKVPISDIWHGSNCDECWRSTVELWRAGLDAEGWQAVVRAITFDGTRLSLESAAAAAASTDALHARLSGNFSTEICIRLSREFLNSKYRSNLEEDNDHLVVLLYQLATVREGKGGARKFDWAAELLNVLLRRAGHKLSYSKVKDVVYACQSDNPDLIERSILARLVKIHPQLLDDIPQLRGHDGFPYATVES